jgi:hypothetical protein
MLFDKSLKLFPITDFAVVLRVLPRLRLNIPRFGFALAPQVNCVATDIEQLTCLTFLETVQLDRLHYFFPKILTVGLSHFNGVDAIETLIVYVLTKMAIAIPVNKAIAFPKPQRAISLG